MRNFAIPLIVLVGALASRYAATQVPSQFAIDLAQPIPVVTTWGSAGIAPVAILLITIAIAFALYLLALRQEAPPRTIALSCAAATLAIGFLWLPIFSSDTYAYAAYGEVARLGGNPYAPIAPGANALLDAALWQWKPAIPACVYGPAFVWIAQITVTFAHGLGIAFMLNVFRVLSCACLLACGALLPKRAAFFLCCNPVVLWAAIEGHNDPIMVLVVLAGIDVARRYARIGAAIATLGALIKAPALAAGAAMGVLGIIERRSFAPITGFILACAILALALGEAITGIGSGVAAHGAYAPAVSVQALSPLAAVVVAAVVMWRMHIATTWIDRGCLVALVLWLAIPNPYPWYSLWLLPIAAFASDRRIVACSLAVSAVAMLRYIPDAVGTPVGMGAIILGVAATVAYLPLFTRAIISRS